MGRIWEGCSKACGRESQETDQTPILGYSGFDGRTGQLSVFFLLHTRAGTFLLNL